MCFGLNYKAVVNNFVEFRGLFFTLKFPFVPLGTGLCRVSHDIRLETSTIEIVSLENTTQTIQFSIEMDVLSSRTVKFKCVFKSNDVENRS